MMMKEKQLQETELIQAALEARDNAYAPYSGFRVGAAVFTTEGKILTGCNVENASYGATICAERVAITKAISEGNTKITSIAIVGGPGSDTPKDYAYPCGICRQVMVEFATRDTVVIVAKSVEDYKTYCLEELHPEAFDSL